MSGRLLLCFALSACAATVPRLPIPSLSQGGDGPKATALTAAFYDNDHFDAAAFSAQLEDALTSEPGSATVREIAMLWARLRGEHDAAFRHALVAAADTSSPFATWFIAELERGDRTLSQQRAAIDFLRKVYVSHPLPRVRSEAALTLAKLLQTFDERSEADALFRWLGYMSQFSYIGPFDNDQGKGFAAVYAPEQSFTPSERYKGKILDVGWKTLARTNEERALWIDDVISPADQAVVYLATFVRAPEAKEVFLHVRCGAALKLWLNDAPVLSEEKLTAGRGDNVIVPVRLAAGWNKLLFKIAEQKSTSFAARFSDLAGAPLTLEGSATAQAYVADKTTPVHATPFGLQGAIDGLSSPGRKAYWQTREAYRRGDTLSVVPLHETLRQRLGDHPLAIFDLAIAYSDNDELGKAIDLLNKGSERYGDLLPAFLVRRARFYRQKKQHDRAQRDLERALVKAPKSRALRVELADLLEARGFGPESRRVLLSALADWPDSPSLQHQIARSFSLAGLTSRADALYREIANARPGENGGWSRLVERDVRLGDYAAAIRRLQRMQAREPMTMALVLQQADLERRSEDYAAAERTLSRAIANDPDWATPYERLATLHDERADRARSLVGYKQALARDPRNTFLAERVDSLEPKGEELAERYAPNDAAIDQTIEAAERVKIEAGAHIVMLLDHEVTEVASDGSSKRYVTLVSQALDDQGRDALTQTSLPNQGTTKVLRAYSVNRRGERQEVSSMQGDAVRYRQLEVGSITVLQYVWYAPPQTFLPNHFAYGWRFESVHRQHEKSVWILLTPKGRPLNVQARGPVKQEQRVDGDHDVRTFSAEHVPALIAEPFMPPPDDVLAAVEVSTVQGWDEYVRWERALLVEAFRSSPEIEALAKRLTEKEPTKAAKLDRILHFVAREIRYQQEYETTIAGVRPHACPVIVERGYGDCKDKSVLIIRLAKLAGITAEFAILRTTNAGSVKKDIPNQQFNHAIVYVPQQDGFEKGFFIDATTEGLDLGNLRADDQGALSLVLDSDGDGYRFIEIPYQSAALDREEHALTVKVTSDARAEAKDTLTLRGGSAAHLRVLLRNQQVAKKTLESVGAYLFAGSTLLDVQAKHHDDIVQPLEIALSMDVSPSLTREGTRVRLKIPAQLSLLRTGALVNRKTDVMLGVPQTTIYRYEIAIPDGHRVAHAPEPFAIEHACFTARRTSETKDRVVKMVMTIERTCTRVKVDEYPRFREALQKLTNATQQEVVFEKRQIARY